jgi:predicted ATPase/DNA-binding winged helix-turn-helix (wHTH) protein
MLPDLAVMQYDRSIPFFPAAHPVDLKRQAATPTAGACLVDTARHNALRFGRFELRWDEGCLLEEGLPAPLQPRAMALLIALVERAGQLVTRQQLLERVWPGQDVEENNLSVQVNALRKVLGSTVIATVPGRGYRFVGPLEAPVLSPVAPASPHSFRSAPGRKTHLPVVLPPLIGRDADLDALRAMVGRYRLVTVTGAGGTGKTRLVRELLHSSPSDYPHGVCFVELEFLTRQVNLPAVVAAALGVVLDEGQPPCKALAQALASLNLLLALDNVEHLVPEVADVVQALWAGAPGVRILLTGQVRLGLSEEWLYQLAALAVPAAPVSPAEALKYGAVALFVARARSLNRRFTLNKANAGQVAEVCRRLDGSALAIELAATRLSLLGPARLLASLDHRLSLLTQGHRTAPPRQKSLRAALEWSHDLLGGAERIVFRRMAIFSGTVSLEMVQDVLADGPAGGLGPAGEGLDRWAVVAALSGLVDRSLVSVSGSGATCDEEPRYRLLESPRALAAERLRESGEAPQLLRRHAQAVRRLLDRACHDVVRGRAGFAATHDALDEDLGRAAAVLR